MSYNSSDFVHFEKRYLSPDGVRSGEFAFNLFDI